MMVGVTRRDWFLVGIGIVVMPLSRATLELEPSLVLHGRLRVVFVNAAIPSTSYAGSIGNVFERKFLGFGY